MKRFVWLGLVVTGGVLVTAFGCGGVTGADALFDRPGPGSPIGTGQSSTGGTGGTGGETTSSASAGGGMGGATGSSASSASSSSTSSSASSSSTSSSTSSSSSSASSSSSSGSVSLTCGDTSCPLGGNSACCWDNFQTNAAPYASCVDAPADSDGCRTFVANDGLETRIECQFPSQCPALCCAHRTYFNNNSSFYDLVSCKDSCDWPDVQLCDPSAPASGCPILDTQDGPKQTVCKGSTLLPAGYFVCGF